MRCENCGRELPPHTSSCKYCGWSMISDSSEKPKKSLSGILIKVGLIFLAFFAFAMFVDKFSSDSSPSNFSPDDIDVLDDTEDYTEYDYEPLPDVTTEKPKKKKSSKKIKKQYIANCKSYKYKDLARYPEKYVGEKIKLTARINQVMDGGLFDDGTYYVCYTDNDGSGYYMDDCYYISDDRVGDSTKLLEDDIIEIYGEIQSQTELESALLGTSENVVTISMKYYKLISE